MKVKVGSIVNSELGIGTVLAITAEWVIVRCKSDSREYALLREDGPIWVDPEFEIGGGDKMEIELDAGGS